MNWNKIKRFNFTYALTGGAWLEDSTGYRNWESFTTIRQHKGQIWIDAMLRKQGWMTGCWVDCDETESRRTTITDKGNEGIGSCRGTVREYNPAVGTWTPIMSLLQSPLKKA